MRKLFILSLFILNLFSCLNLDVIGKDSIRAFRDLIFKTNIDNFETNDSYIIRFTEGEIFGVSKDFSLTEKDIYFEIASNEFLNAGLDLNKLPKNYVFNSESGNIVISFNIDNNIKSNGGIVEIFKEIVKKQRKIISYHEELDHYGIDSGNGNVFEWAKDFKTNDKDMVFVLNPEPFINAGLIPENLETWSYIKVRTKDKSGNTIEIYKILKSYDIGEKLYEM